MFDDISLYHLSRYWCLREFSLWSALVINQHHVSCTFKNTRLWDAEYRDTTILHWLIWQLQVTRGTKPIFYTESGGECVVSSHWPPVRPWLMCTAGWRLVSLASRWGRWWKMLGSWRTFLLLVTFHSFSLVSSECDDKHTNILYVTLIVSWFKLFALALGSAYWSSTHMNQSYT